MFRDNFIIRLFKGTSAFEPTPEMEARISRLSAATKAPRPWPTVTIAEPMPTPTQKEPERSIVGGMVVRLEHVRRESITNRDQLRARIEHYSEQLRQTESVLKVTEDSLIAHSDDPVLTPEERSLAYGVLEERSFEEALTAIETDVVETLRDIHAVTITGTFSDDQLAELERAAQAGRQNGEFVRLEEFTKPVENETMVNEPTRISCEHFNTIVHETGDGNKVEVCPDCGKNSPLPIDNWAARAKPSLKKTRKLVSA